MRVAMVVHSHFPSDPRVRKEARALEGAGHDVEVVCLRREAETAEETVGTIRVHRMNVTRRRSRGRVGYVFEYLHFFMLAMRELGRIDRGRGVDVVHVHNVPDVLVFSATLMRAKGKRVVLDLHDPMPELFADKYGLSPESRGTRLLVRLQMASCRFADHVIVSSEHFKRRLVERGIPADGVSVVINGPELPDRDLDFVLVYHGSLFERYGFETVLRGLSLAEKDAPGVQLLVFASDVDPAYLGRMKSLAEQLGISGRVTFSGPIMPAAVHHVLAGADAGVVPARRSDHIDLVYSTKLFEYLVHGLPVLAARTPPVEHALGSRVNYYEADDPVDFAQALQALIVTRSATERREKPSLLPRELEWQSIAPLAVAAIVGGPVPAVSSAAAAVQDDGN